WAIGAMLFELLSGECPYQGPTGPIVLARILSEPAPSLITRAPDVPAPLAAIVMRALSRDPGARFPTMAALLEAVLDFARKPDPSLPLRHAKSIPPAELAP